MTHPTPIVWSAAKIVFYGAGAYVGLASCPQHYTVARWVLPKRGAIYGGSYIRVRPDTRWPLFYFAIRDPSVVAVLRSERRRIAGEPDHVMLRFAFNHAVPKPPPLPPEVDKAEMVKRLCTHASARDHGIFLLTIGLPIQLECEFHRSVALSHPDESWPDLCARVAEFGARPER